MNKISQTATSFVPCEKIITCEHIFTMSSFPCIKVIPKRIQEDKREEDRIKKSKRKKRLKRRRQKKKVKKKKKEKKTEE